MIKRPVAIFADSSLPPDFGDHTRLEANKIMQLQIRAMLVAMAVLECANSAATFVLPFYLHEAKEMEWIGVIIGVYHVISLSTASWFGSLSDRLGRKRFIVGGAFLIGLTYLPFPTFKALQEATGIPGPLILMLANVGKGIGAAMMAGSIIAIFADITSPETRGETMGKFYLFRAVGGAIGFVVGGVSWVLIGAGGYIGFAFIIFIAGLLFLRMREPRKFAIMIRELEPPLETSNPFTTMLEVLRNRQFRTFAIVWLAYTSMIGSIITYLPQALTEVAEGVDMWALGLVILLVLVIAGGAQPVYGRLSDKYGRKPFLLLGVQSTAIAVFFLYQLLIVNEPATIASFMKNPFSSLAIRIDFGTISVSVSSYILLIFLIAVLLGAAAFPACSMGFLTDVTDEDERGQGMGLYSSLQAVGNIFGIVLGGFFRGQYGVQGFIAFSLFLGIIAAIVLIKFLIETTTFRWLPGT
ncbi:MAG: MFS transporter [Candidatus Heimdallarchaeota archaeon]